jgi:hypothetical protein
MLVLYTICFEFCYTLWHFYAFPETNLLTRCQCQFPVFCCFCVSQKLHGKYSRNWTKQKWTSYFYRSFAKTEDETEGGQRPATPQGARPSPWPRPPMVRLPGPPPDNAPSPIKSPRREKPKGRIAFPRNILQATAVVETRLGGCRSSSRHPAGEGNPCRRTSTPPWSPPEWCVSSLPWTMGP